MKKIENKKETKINNYSLSLATVKSFLFGKNEKMGFLGKFFTYLMLIVIGFIFIYPLLFMLSFSFKSLTDLLNSSVQWLPSSFYLGNFEKAFEVLDYVNVLSQTLFIAITPSLVQMVVTALVGYGIAIYPFKGRNILLGIIIATFVIPPQILVIPRYILFNKLGLVGSIFAYILPASLGQGINSAIFILIFYQTFKVIPKALIEAARLDGAGEWKIFWRISVPMGVSSFIITFLFSLVWYWNETYLASIYFGDKLSTLPLQLQKFVSTYNKMFPSGAGQDVAKVNEGIELAATLLTIVPLLIIYFIAQKWFVESIDKSGITGE